MNEKPSETVQYNVQVGHWRVEVPAHDVSDAIEKARRRLREDMPRLWDLISNLTSDRFQVEAAT